MTIPDTLECTGGSLNANASEASSSRLGSKPCSRRNCIKIGAQRLKGLSLSYLEESHKEPAESHGHEASMSTDPQAVDLVQELRARLRAAEARELELHQHLVFHMQEKDALIKQMEELRKMCDQLLRSQAAGGDQQALSPPYHVNGSCLTAINPTAPVPTVPPMAPILLGPPTACLGSSDCRTSPQVESVYTPGESGSVCNGDVHGTSSEPRGDDEYGMQRKEQEAETGPVVDIPLLLREKGGQIRISELWESYQEYFGPTSYTLRDLFAMVKAGSIPGVVHEPLVGIRLLEPLGAPQPDSSGGTAAPIHGAAIPGDNDGSERGPGDGLQKVAGGTPVHAKEAPGSNATEEVGSNDLGDGDLGATCRDSTTPGNSPRTSQDSTADASTGARGAQSDETGTGWRGKGRPSRRRPVDERREHREVNWREVTRNLNLLLMEEGALAPQEVHARFAKRFQKPLSLDEVPVRYAVASGWINGVCFDKVNERFNLVVRVPAERREEPPEEFHRRAPPRTQTSSSGGSGLHQNGGRQHSRNGDANSIDWKLLSEEFRTILASGPLEPREIHATYCRTLRKQPFLGEYSMRDAVECGLLEGVAAEEDSKRLMLSRRS